MDEFNASVAIVFSYSNALCRILIKSANLAEDQNCLTRSILMSLLLQYVVSRFQLLKSLRNREILNS